VESWQLNVRINVDIMMDIMVIQIIPKGIDSAPHVAILFLPQNFLVPAVIKHLGENHDD